MRAERGQPLRAHLAAVLWSLAVGVALLLPADRIPALPDWTPLALAEHAGTAVHVLLFFVSALVFHRSLRAAPALRHPLAWAVVAAIAYGGALELLQAFVPGRDVSWVDGCANAAGGALYSALCALRG